MTPLGPGAQFRDHWLVGAIAGAPLLLALLPLLLPVWPGWLLWVFVQQPAYMLHQAEEHVRDRFRIFVNLRMAGGVEALSPLAVCIINVLGVWAVNALALLGAGLLHPGWGLLAPYLTLVNALVHVVGAIVQRGYNPGLVTAVLLFLPLGGFGLAAVAAQPGVGLAAHALALAGIVLLHLAIVVHVRRRVATLRPALA